MDDAGDGVGDEVAARRHAVVADAGSAGAFPTRQEVVRECEALLVYVARNGDVLAAYADLEEACAELGRMVGRCSGRAVSDEDWAGLLAAYAGVTRMTHRARGVTGRSVLDTWKVQEAHWVDGRRRLLPARGSRRFLRPFAMAAALAVAGLMLQVFVTWTKWDPAAREGDVPVPDVVADDLLALVVPAVCGGFGSSVYLIKVLSDKLAAFAYEEARLTGDGTRVFLGAALGVVVAMMFFPESHGRFEVADITIGPVVASFLAGFGVEPVFAVFERVVGALTGAVSGRGERGG